MPNDGLSVYPGGLLNFNSFYYSVNIWRSLNSQNPIVLWRHKYKIASVVIMYTVSCISHQE